MAMPGRVRQLVEYVAYGLIAGVLWGLVMFFLFTWLVGYSVLLAYLVNIALIVAAVAADERAFRMYDRYLESDEALRRLARSRFFRLFLDAFVSFKAILYLFYILIMMFSQAIADYPGLVPQSVKAFISANEYSVVVLVAVDLFSGQLRIDRQRRRQLATRFEQRLTEMRDE